MGQRLRISVEDTGPGMDAPVQQSLLEYMPDGAAKPVSTGVGLGNIRNRLAQSYDDDHLFETRSQPGGGFTVLIEIPYRSARESAAEETSTVAPQVTRSDEPAQNAQPSGNVINLNPQRAIGNS